MTVVLFGKRQRIGVDFSFNNALIEEKNYNIVNQTELDIAVLCLNSLIQDQNFSKFNTLISEINFKYLNKLCEIIPINFTYKNLIEYSGIKNDRELINSLTSETNLKYSNKLSEINTINLMYKNLIEHSDIKIDRKLINSFLATQINSVLKNEIRDKVFKDVKVLNVLDVLIELDLSLLNDLVLQGVEKDFIYPVDYMPQQVTQDILVKADGQDITNKVQEIEIVLFSENMTLSSLSMQVASNEDMEVSQIEIIIQNNSLSFIVDEIEYDKKGNKVSFWGRSELASLYEPYSPRNSYKYHNKMASEIVRDILGNNVIYDIDDWIIEEFYETDVYPLDAARAVASAVGGQLRCLPDGKAYLVYPDNSPSRTLDKIFSLKKTKTIGEASQVSVVCGGDQNVYISADKSEVRPYEWAYIKVYSKYPYELHTPADVVEKIAEKQEEIVTESFNLEDGQGIFQRPVYEVLEVRGCDNYTIEGQTITSDVCSSIDVDIKTYYDLYRITNYTEARKLVCSVITDNSYTIGSGLKKVFNEKYTIPSLASKKALYELYRAQGGYVYEIETLFDVDFIAPNLVFKIGQDLGIVTKNSIKITSNPLKIKSFFEVKICHL